MYHEARDVHNVLEEVKELIAEGSDVNAENRFHDTPLHFAVRHSKNKLDVIKDLLEFGANVNAKDWHGDTPLHSVFNYRDNHLEIFRATRHLRYNVVHRFRNTPLHNVMQNGTVDSDVIRYLLRHGAHVNAKNWGANSPLHFAVKFRNNGLKEIELLVRYGANINAQNLIGDTPLHKAVLKQGNKVGAIKQLRKLGADFTLKNSTDETPLLLFMRECVVKQCEGTSLCDLDCAKYLIKCTLIEMSRKVDLGAVPIEPTLKELLTMFDKGLLNYYEECVSEILQMKADVLVNKKTMYDYLLSGETLAEGNLKPEEVKNVVDYLFHLLAKNTYPLLGLGFVMNMLSRSDLYDKLSELRICSAHYENSEERIIRLYSCSTLKIASHLSCLDLINLILAIYGVEENNAIKTTNLSACPTESNDLKRSLSSFSGCCTKHARLESPSATGFDYSFESIRTLQRYEQD